MENIKRLGTVKVDRLEKSDLSLQIIDLNWKTRSWVNNKVQVF